MIRVFLLCDGKGGIVRDMTYIEAAGFIELMKSTKWVYDGVEYIYKEHSFDASKGIEINMVRMGYTE